MGSEEKQEPVVHPAIIKILSDVRIIIGILTSLVVAVFLAGWSAFAAVREEAASVAKATTAGQSERQDQLWHVVGELRAEVRESRDENRDTRQEVKELRGDLRRIFPKLENEGK